jgi:hypothetical protein
MTAADLHIQIIEVKVATPGRDLTKQKDWMPKRISIDFNKTLLELQALVRLCVDGTYSSRVQHACRLPDL